MTGANLYNADLTDTRVSDKILKDTVLCKTIMPSGQTESRSCRSAIWQKK
jgi:hypothetical protein